MTLVARAPRPTDGWAVTTGPCGRPVGASLSSGSGETPRQCGPDSGHDTRRHRAVGIANPCACLERGNQTLCVRSLERFTFQIHSYQLRRLGIPDTCCVRERSSSRAESSGVCRHGARARATAHAHTTAKIGRCQDPSAGGTIAVLPRLPCPSSISYIVAPPSLRVA